MKNHPSAPSRAVPKQANRTPFFVNASLSPPIPRIYLSILFPTQFYLPFQFLIDLQSKILLYLKYITLIPLTKHRNP